MALPVYPRTVLKHDVTAAMDAANVRPASPRVTVDLGEMPEAIVTSLFAVLEQRGYCLTRYADTQYPLDGAALSKLQREIGRNVAGAVAALDGSERAA